MKPPQQIPSGEFQRNFGKLAEDLKSGESIIITKRGRIIGAFAKAANRPAPDYLANLDRLPPYPARVGQQIIDDACDARALKFLAGLDERLYLPPKALKKVIREARGLS